MTIRDTEGKSALDWAYDKGFGEIPKQPINKSVATAAQEIVTLLVYKLFFNEQRLISTVVITKFGWRFCHGGSASVSPERTENGE